MFGAVLIAVLGVSEAPEAAVHQRLIDVEVTAFASTPERFSACVAAHPGRPIEVDLCVSPDVGIVTLSTHVFARRTWALHCFGAAQRCLELAFGGGVGVRASRFCPFATCAIGGGPEFLASLEAVQWLTPGFGITLQADGGLAVVWAEAAPNVVKYSFRFPARLLAGVTF